MNLLIYRGRAAVLALGLSLACLPAARADVIFTNFGPGDAYDTGSGLTISGVTSPVGATYIQGSNFTAGVTANLSEIDVPFFLAAGSGLFNLGLYADDGTGHLGSLIESFQNIGPAVNSPGSIFSVSSALHPLLSAGVSYWLIASPADTGSWVAWDFATTGATSTVYTSLDGSASYNADRGSPAFRVIGASVPEPSSIALLGLGGVAAAVGLRRRRAARA